MEEVASFPPTTFLQTESQKLSEKDSLQMTQYRFHQTLRRLLRTVKEFNVVPSYAIGITEVLLEGLSEQAVSEILEQFSAKVVSVHQDIQKRDLETLVANSETLFPRIPSEVRKICVDALKDKVNASQKSQLFDVVDALVRISLKHQILLFGERNRVVAESPEKLVEAISNFGISAKLESR